MPVEKDSALKRRPELPDDELAMLDGEEGRFSIFTAGARLTSKLGVNVVLFGLWLQGQPIIRVPAVFGPPSHSTRLSSINSP